MVAGAPVKKDLLNLSALTCIQASNALVPLIMFPFLLVQLGSSVYAQLALAEALSLLVLAVVIFSFEIVGISELVKFRERSDRDAINELFSSVFYIRLALFIAAAPFAILFYVLILGNSAVIIALWLLVPLAYIFQSAWLYQGFEENLPLAAFTLLSRVGSLGLVFLMVGNSGDAYLVPTIVGGAYLLGGLAAFGYAMKRHGLRLRRIAVARLMSVAVDGKEIFLTNVAVSVQRDLNVLILGVVGIPAQSIAAYSIAEKFTKSVQAIARPLNQLFFPKTIRAIRNETQPSTRVARIIARHTAPQIVLVVLALIGLAATYFALTNFTQIQIPFENVDEIIVYISIMAPTIVFGIASYMFGSVGLNYLGGRRHFLNIILITGVLSALSCFVLTYWIGAYAAAITYAAAEIATMAAVVARYVRRPPLGTSAPS